MVQFLGSKRTNSAAYIILIVDEKYVKKDISGGTIFRF